MLIFFLCRDTASETVRTLLVYGYNLDPPTGETNEGILSTCMLSNRQFELSNSRCLPLMLFKYYKLILRYNSIVHIIT